MHRRLRIRSLALSLALAIALGACARESSATQNRPTEWNVIIAEPTGGGPLVVSFQGHLVPNRAFSSQDAFLHTFHTAERVNMTYTLHAA